jgi:8-oxo-dGTP pyrophosphatase MutT (NUDIX family)
MPKAKFKLAVAVYLVLIKNNKALLLRRFDTGYEDGNYSFPGGRLDGNESIKAAVKREAKEELGIDIDPGDIQTIHVMHRRANFPRIGFRERMGVFASAADWRGKIKNAEPNKCDDLNWFSLDDLPKNTVDYISFALDKIKKEIFYSEFGW